MKISNNMAAQEIRHGIPRHDYFAILQPTDRRGGMDCAGIGRGIGLRYKLVNPYTKEEVEAILVCRRTIYTSSAEFEALAYILYGTDKDTLLGQLRARHEEMIEEIVEIWTFKKD